MALPVSSSTENGVNGHLYIYYEWNSFLVTDTRYISVILVRYIILVWNLVVTALWKDKPYN